MLYSAVKYFRKSIVLGVLVSLGLAASMLAGCDEGPGPARQSITTVITDSQDAWNNGDLDKFMSFYAEDQGFTYASGKTIVRGRDNLYARYAERYGTDKSSMGKLNLKDLEITILGENAAMAFGQFEVLIKEQKYEGLFTLVLRKIDGKWLIVHDHSS